MSRRRCRSSAAVGEGLRLRAGRLDAVVRRAGVLLVLRRAGARRVDELLRRADEVDRRRLLEDERAGARRFVVEDRRVVATPNHGTETMGRRGPGSATA